MTKFQITNSASGASLGIYEADTAEKALDAMAVSAGYASYAALQGDVPGEFEDIVTEVQTPFAEDKAAKEALTNLVGDLISVAEEAGQIPSDWDSISCDGSLDGVLDELGGQYLEAKRHGDDVELRDEITEFLEEVTVDWTSGKPDELARAIVSAKSLVSLREALIDADAYAKANNVDFETIYDAAGLPTFGGTAIDRDGVYSWDSQDMLIGHGDWEIVSRGHEIGETIHQQSGGFTIGDIQYRYEDRFYLGSDKLDVIRFSRWKERDEHTNVFAGYINVPAFARDEVLLSEMIAAVEKREAEL